MELIQKLLNAQHTGCQADIRLQQSSYAYLAQAVRTTVSWYAASWQHLPPSHHRLGHSMSNSPGRLTSRSATPLGDPRGVPKRNHILRRKVKYSKLLLDTERLFQLIFIIRSIAITKNLSFKKVLKRLEAKMADHGVLSDIDIVELLDSIMDDSNKVTNSDSNDFGFLPSLAVTNVHNDLEVLDNFDLEHFGDVQQVNPSQTSFQSSNNQQLNTTETSFQSMYAPETGSNNTGTQQLFTGQTSFNASQTGFEISTNTVQQLENYAETNSVETNNRQQLYVNTLSTAQSCQYVQTNMDQSQDYQVYSISPIQQPIFIVNPIASEEQTGNFAPVFNNSNPSYLSPETSYSNSSSLSSPTSCTVSDSQTSTGSQSPSSSNGGFSDCSLSPSSSTDSATTSKKSSKTKRNYKNPEKVKADNLRACERYREKKKRAEEALKKEHKAVVNRNDELKTTLNKLQQELIRLQTKIIMEKITI